jgi:ubiquinone/menaquinone biosynthesis C-methylase UbiE
MSDWAFRAMTWAFAVMDLFSSPSRKLSRLSLERGMTVVDYACGPGRYCIPIARFVGPAGKVYAVDVHPLAIRMVRGKAAREGLANIDAILVDSCNTGIPASCADVVLVLDAFHQVEDRPALLREISRIIKPEGTLLIEPGHMDLDKARDIVVGTGLFAHVTTWRRDMRFSPADSPHPQTPGP